MELKGLHGRRIGYLEFRFGLERRFEFPFEVFSVGMAFQPVKICYQW